MNEAAHVLFAVAAVIALMACFTSDLKGAATIVSHVALGILLLLACAGAWTVIGMVF